jgi:FAD-linked oxidoreductase
MSHTTEIWTNWAATATATHKRRVTPRSATEIGQAIAAAAEEKLTVRALGSGHSFTPAAVTSGVALDLTQYNGIADVNFATKEVAVRAGTTIKQLNAALDTLGLAMPNMGDIDAQTISGAISTGTHGTGARLGGIATQVRALEIVTAAGLVVRCSADENPGLFAAARIGLGAFGVISTVTLETVPAFNLRADEHVEPLTSVLERLDSLATDNDHFEFYWFPYGEKVLVKRNNRLAPTEPTQPLSALRQYFEYEIVENKAFSLLCKLGKSVPSLIKPLNRLSAEALSARSYSDVSHRVFVTSRDVRFTESEYAIPRAALSEVLAELKREVPKLKDAVIFPVEIRFAASDDISLSTAYDRDSAYIAIHQYKGMPYQEYFAIFESIVAQVDGRPHWGKMHTKTAEDFGKLYPKFGDFLTLRDEYDPERRFTNPYLDSVLG